MKHCNESQNWEVLDDCCYHVTFALRAFCSKSNIITEEFTLMSNLFSYFYLRFIEQYKKK